jgi:regulator of replication initiation timing
MNEIIKTLKQEIQSIKMKLSAQLEENVRLRGFKQMVLDDPGKYITWKERAEEAEEALANALASDERQKEADQKMMVKLERIQELEQVNEDHQKLNGDLRREITALEQEKLELHLDNKKLAQQVDDSVSRLRKEGIL